jgi:hypothetical protein
MSRFLTAFCKAGKRAWSKIGHPRQYFNGRVSKKEGVEEPEPITARTHMADNMKVALIVISILCAIIVICLVMMVNAQQHAKVLKDKNIALTDKLKRTERALVKSEVRCSDVEDFMSKEFKAWQKKCDEQEKQWDKLEKEILTN